MTKDIIKFADAAMFEAAPMLADRDAKGNIVPRVTLLSMSPDPLGVLAAMYRMYAGTPTYNLHDITDKERQDALTQIQKTHLKAPLESVKVHFFIEGVTRSFTHQMVRQRTAVYAQESLRFAVTDDLLDRVSVPPSIVDNEAAKVIFDDAVGQIEEAYNKLIAMGIPAEDARALTPHGVTTRLNYVTDMKNLCEHAGNRLCTQAQFEWRIVFMGIVQAIRDFKHHPSVTMADMWQFDAIADSGLFAPICYKTGKCEFMAEIDRFCSIRDRVQEFHSIGVKPEDWDARDKTKAADERRKGRKGIFPGEWLSDPTAARIGTAGND